ATQAQAIRNALCERVGSEIRAAHPGSVAAARLKQALLPDGQWSQYREGAMRPEAEVFTKAAELPSVCLCDLTRELAEAAWNHHGAVIVLSCDARGRVLGATLGNDVNLHDSEGRSALLLGKANDNNAACAIGPFIRLFDAHFRMDQVRHAQVSLQVHGADGFE